MSQEYDQGSPEKAAQPLEYQDIAYDEYVRARQGTRDMTLPRTGEVFEIAPEHQQMIKNANHFFLSTVTGAGWPYVQHRGGPQGFVHVLSPTRLGWLEFQGNHQFVSTGNMDRDGRVCMFFVDYATRFRLKVFGVGRVVEAEEDPELMETLTALHNNPDRDRIRSKYERAMVVDVVATDKNCSKNITPRYTKQQVDERIDLYRQDITELKEKIAELEEQLAEKQGE